MGTERGFTEPCVCPWIDSAGGNVFPCTTDLLQATPRAFSPCWYSCVYFLCSVIRSQHSEAAEQNTFLEMAFAFERQDGCSRDFTTSLTSSVQSPGSVLTVLNLGLHALIPATCIWLKASLNCPVSGWLGEPSSSSTNYSALRTAAISVLLPPVPGNSPGNQQMM